MNNIEFKGDKLENNTAEKGEGVRGQGCHFKESAQERLP